VVYAYDLGNTGVSGREAGDAGRTPDGPGTRDASDAQAGFDVLDHFQRFSQKNDIYSRAFWDESVRSDRTDRFFDTYRTPLKKWKKAEGFRQKDYALRNASWHVPDIFAELKGDENRREGFLDPFTVHRDGPEERVPVESPTEMSRELKHVGKVFGADLVGITGYDERWVYTHAYSRQGETEKPQELPDDLPNVVVIAQEMDRALIETVPSALSGTATGVGYSHDTLVLLGLAQYIRNLGYRAVATMNDTALAIPYAIKAGLGEYGRHGLLITKEFGPRVRIGKIFTDLPLAHDAPTSFGVREFCGTCRRCSDACPVGAIPSGAPSEEVYNRSNLIGVRKWSVDAESCFRFWSNQNSDCSICVRVCPYNRDLTGAGGRAWIWLAGTPLRRLALWLSNVFAPGDRVSPDRWWRRGAGGG
jgi:epoxyqueuosine reductase